MMWLRAKKNLDLKLAYFIAMFFSMAVVADEAVDIKLEEKVVTKRECDRLIPESEDWFDVTHSYLSVQFCEPAAWFDSFFSSPRTEEEFRPGSRVRWTHDFVFTEGKGFDYVTDFHFSFKLPKAKKNINIIFEGEQDEDLKDIVPGNREDTGSELGLLYEVKETLRANLSLRIKLSPSITLRYRYEKPVSPTFITRFTQELFRKDSVYGRTSRLDFEKKLSADWSFRQSNEGTVAENIDGTQWSTSFVLLQRLSDISALSYESSATGVTDPDNITKNVRLGVRYRRNFYRSWLFYEIVPAVNWPKALVTDERVPVWEMLFRLEANFVNL